MADISKIILPDASEYDVKDTTARSQAGSAYALASSATSTANTANNRANSAYNLANAAVPRTSIITDAQIEQIWEDN